MELGEDLQPHEGGFIDDQYGDLLSLGYFEDGGTQGFGKPGQGVGLPVHVEAVTDLSQDVGHGSGGGDDRDDLVLRGVEFCGGVSEGGGFAASHIAGDNGGGAEVQGAFFDAGLVDKFHLFLAPKFIGGRQAPGILGGLGASRLAEAQLVHDLSIRRIGEDILISGYLTTPAG